jgi:hypothetical protein
MEALLVFIIIGLLLIALTGSNTSNSQLQALEAENQAYRTLLSRMTRQNNQSDSDGCLVPFIIAVVLVAVVLLVLVA